MLSFFKKLTVAALSSVAILSSAPPLSAQQCVKDAASSENSLLSVAPRLKTPPAKTNDFVPIGPSKSAHNLLTNTRSRISYRAPKRVAAIPLANASLAIGNVYSSDNWGESKLCGPYALGLSEYSAQRLAASAGDGLAASFYFDGKFFMATAQTFLGLWYDNTLVEIFDATTWECLSSQNLKVPEFALLDAAWNPADNTIYATMINGDSYSFGSFNPDDCSFSPIANLGGNGFVGLAIHDSEGYGFNQYGDLYKIGLYTGEIKLVGATDLSIDTKTSAAIDPADGSLYFLTNGSVSSLYEVSKTTARANKVYDFANNERVMGFAIPQIIAAGAPEAPTGLSVTPVGATLSCDISFNIPGTYHDGSTASGNVTYAIFANGTNLANDEAAYGTEVSATVTVPSSGMYTFSVALSNEAGTSAYTSIKAFVGEDTPKPTASVTLERTATDMLTLSWETPEPANGGYIDPEAISYDIADIHGNTIKSGIKGNSCDIEFSEPEILRSYQYSVTAIYNGEHGTPAWSNILYFGNIKPPYEVSFSQESSIDGFSIIDANNDGDTWLWYDNTVRCPYNSTNQMDDWLITPGIILEAGKTYGLSVIYSASFDERIEIKAGTSPEAVAMDLEILAPTDVSSYGQETLEASITPTADGIYYIGFHGISDPDQYFLTLHGFSIQPPVESLLPGKCDDLSVVPDYTGEKKVAIGFTAPATTVSGTELTSLVSATLMRDGEVIKVFESPAPAPGHRYVYEDTECAGGMTNYSLYFTNEIGDGETVSANAFVGINLPSAIKEAYAEIGAEPGSIIVSWDEVTSDIDGKTPPAGTIKYELVEINGNSQTSIAKDLTTNYYVIENAYDPSGLQIFKQWGVFPVNETGYGEGAATNGLLLGSDYTLPFAESFAGAALSNIWFVEQPSGPLAAEVGLLTDTSFSDVRSQDGDNGLLAMTASYYGSSASILSGYINLNLPDPVLTFYSFGITEDNTNEIAISVDCGNGDEPVKTFVINGGMSWNRYRADLSDYAGQTVRIKITGTLTGATTILLDNISIDKGTGYDLAATSISAPRKLKPGESATVKVKVENFGSMPSGSYTLDLFADGKIVNSAEGEPLSVGQNRAHDFDIACNVTSPDSFDLYAVVTYGADEMTDNNKTETVTISVPKPDFPAPANLVATPDGTTVSLEWSAVVLPEFAPGPVVEDFESADSFKHEVAGWTMVDRDGGLAGGIDGTDIPGIVPKQTRCSFFVMDNAELGGSENLNAHSGDKCVATIFNYDDSRIDDWAISPVLTGNAQTIAFFARSFHATYLENIEVYYTLLDSTDPADYKKIEGAGGVVPAEWTPYSAELPSGALHFAIRSCAAGSFILLVDDIAYEGFQGVELNHLGYHVYANGAKVTDSAIADCVLRINDLPEGHHTFHVTALYDRGESRASEAAIAEISSAGAVTASPAVISVRNHELIITGADGDAVSVTSADGRIIFSAIARSTVRKHLSAGVYIVTAGDKTEKIVVK